MTFKEEDGLITIQMTRDDYDRLLLVFGMRLYDMWKPEERGGALFWGSIDLLNRMNAGNPNFAPYEIPEEFRRAR